MNTQWIESAYVQDEWHLAAPLVVNYGLRFDHYTAFSSGSQLSPRVNFVWQAAENTTVHAGYSRFFSAPPFELVGGTTVAKFANTSAAPAVTTDDPVRAERSNYYDAGIQQTLPKAVTVGVDSYYKQAIHLIDEGKFGAPIILTPFNYRYGQVYGVEFTGSYTSGHFQAYGNVALQRAMGKHFKPRQFNFSPDDLAYVADHYIHLDHEQQVTMSGGAAYQWHGTRVSGDILVGSGLRSSLVVADGTTIPNGATCPTTVRSISVYSRLRRRRHFRPHAALRCDQRLRPEIPDPQRHGSGRRGAAVRPAARIVRRRDEDLLRPRGGALVHVRRARFP